MATNSTQSQSKKMEYKQVSFDINEITPDAPEGEWQASIPRGKIKVHPMKEDRFAMLIVPLRLDKTEEEGEEFEKALGTELSTYLVFGGKTPRGERMSKLRIRQVLEAADVDLDIIPKELTDPENDLEPLIRALEGKKFAVWTVLQERRDTGEITTEVRFTNPDRALARNSDGDDDDDDEAPESEAKPRTGAKGKPAAKKGNGKRR